MWLTPHATGMLLGHCPPVVWSQKTHGEGTSFPWSRQRPEGLKMMTLKISLPPWQTKLLSLLNKRMISGLGWNYPNIQVSVSFHWLASSDFYDNPLRWIPWDLIDQLLQVMAWCHHARSHHLNLCSPRSQILYCAIRPQWVKPQG